MTAAYGPTECEPCSPGDGIRFLGPSPLDGGPPVLHARLPEDDPADAESRLPDDDPSEFYV